MGYINKVLQSIQSDKQIYKKIGLLVLRSITCSNACLEALTQLDTIQSIVNGMRQRSADTVPVVCEALNYLFASKMSELVNQSLKSGIIPMMLDLLRGGQADLGPSPSAVKANIVQALQYMSQDEVHGQEVEAILAKSEVWKQYRDQKHDLFLSDKPIAGYLGSSSSSVAGYLTQGAMSKSSSIPNSPPPLIE
jgi:DnaJ family protein C protein 13